MFLTFTEFATIIASLILWVLTFYRNFFDKINERFWAKNRLFRKFRLLFVCLPVACTPVACLPVRLSACRLFACRLSACLSVRLSACRLSDRGGGVL